MADFCRTHSIALHFNNDDIMFERKYYWMPKFAYLKFKGCKIVEIILDVNTMQR
jgi:hypothetical protein